VRAGHDPAGLCRDAGVVIPTYCNDTVVRMPPECQFRNGPSAHAPNRAARPLDSSVARRTRLQPITNRKTTGQLNAREDVSPTCQI
jgi:hypothetical protein